MGKILLAKNFYKSVPSDKLSRVKALCQRIEQQLLESNRGIFGTSLSNQTRKFEGQNHLYKFRANDGDRIIFTYTKYVKEIRGEYHDAIYLIEYVSHDQQGKEANKIKKDMNKGIADQENNGETIEFADEEEYHKYNGYLDIYNSVIYLINEDKLSTLFEQKTELMEVYISDQQYEYVCTMEPTILMGGAGSGKTIVSLHKLNIYSGHEGKTAYFTYSEHLKNRAKKLFQRIRSDEKRVEFFTPVEFCLKNLNLREGCLVSLPWFQKHFQYIRKGKRLPGKLNAVDVWTEIRGIIKGYMWEKWVRNFPIFFQEIDGYSREILEKKYGYIRQYAGDGRWVQCIDTSQERYEEITEAIKADERISIHRKDTVLNCLNKLFSVCRTFEYKKTNTGWDKRILPLDEYLSLRNDVSIYTKEEREVIYDLCLNYQEFLDENGLYDDNDLAGLYLANLISCEQKPFDYIVVDEVQDLTELQLFLLFNLVNDKRNIMFAGDTHQIINPTYFSSSRVKKLFNLCCAVNCK